MTKVTTINILIEMWTNRKVDDMHEYTCNFSKEMENTKVELTAGNKNYSTEIKMPLMGLSLELT